jgi:hypothetical protein
MMETLYATMAFHAATGLAFWVYRESTRYLDHDVADVADAFFGLAMLPVAIGIGSLAWYYDDKDNKVQNG